MNPSFSVYTNYVTPTPIIIPNPNSQPNRKNQTLDNRHEERTKFHEPDDLHYQLEGYAETVAGVERQYSDDYFHGIPVSSFFIHPLVKNQEARPQDQLVSDEYGTDNQTPVSSIPALLPGGDLATENTLHQSASDETLDSVRRCHASPAPVFENLNPTAQSDLQTQEGFLTRDNAFSTGPVSESVFHWPNPVRQLVDDPRAAIDRLGRTTINLLGRGESRVGFTSTRFGEGCSTIAMSMALWASNHNRSVLLVDGHPNRPQLAQQLGRQATRSWMTSLNGSHSIQDAILHLPEGTVDLLPLTTTAPLMQWPERVFDKLGELLQTVSNQYDLILIDIGPVFQLMTELEMSIHLFDATILTAAVDRTSIVERTRSQKILTSLGVQKMVVAENFVQLPWREPTLTS